MSENHEHHEHHEHHKHHEFEIFVQSRPRKVSGPAISFEEVLKLANIDTIGQDLGLFDVDWTHGHEKGSLTPGQSVEVHNGMRFDAGKSNRS
jgi:hypothetical protein